MSKRRGSTAKRLFGESGISSLEFAVVLPVLLMVFLGGLELTRAWLTANVTMNAVREGARLAAVTIPMSAAKQAGENRISAVLSSAGLTPRVGPAVEVTQVVYVCPPPPNPCPPEFRVEAAVTVRFQTIVPLVQLLLPTPSIDIQQTATMRYE
jgi:Flp pilus assembly protein TadG